MKDCVLICFLKFPEPGHVKTRLAAELGDRNAALLYEAIAERVITEIYPLDGTYDLVIQFDPKHDLGDYQTWIGRDFQFSPQRGNNLGDRLDQAVARAFDSGYQKVAVVGSDCVGMDQPFIEKAFEQLTEKPFVVGPSVDGGYYFLGMNQPSSWIFQDVEWSSETVLETTLDKIEARELSMTLLEAKQDVDTIEDLAKLQQTLPKEHFLVAKINQITMDSISLPISPDEIPDSN